MILDTMASNGLSNDRTTAPKDKRTPGLCRREVKKADGNYSEKVGTLEKGGGCRNGRSSFLRAEQVPEEMREPFILTGYRRPNLPLCAYLMSAFSYNNECMNIWTHVTAAAVLIGRYILVALSHRPLNDPLLYPLAAFTLGASAMYLTSAAVHVFNSRSLRAQTFCFLYDYAAIGTYTFTAGTAFFVYTRPLRSHVLLYDSPAVYFAVSALMSLLGTFLCCQTRTRRDWDNAKFVIRSLAFVVPWFFDTSPFLSRVFWFSNAEPQTSQSLRFFLLHVLCVFVSAVTNASRIPERFLPGFFDFFGHSHNLLHIVMAVADHFAFSVYYLGLTERGVELYKSFVPTFWNTVAPTLMALFVNIAISLWHCLMAVNSHEELTLLKNARQSCDEKCSVYSGS